LSRLRSFSVKNQYIAQKNENLYLKKKNTFNDENQNYFSCFFIAKAAFNYHKQQQFFSPAVILPNTQFDQPIDRQHDYNQQRPLVFNPITKLIIFINSRIALS
jgi:hypothetical protein